MALQFSGKMLDYLRLRYGLKPSTCEMIYGKDTIRVNAWKGDLSVCENVLNFHCKLIYFSRRKCFSKTASMQFEFKYYFTAKVTTCSSDVSLRCNRL